MDRRLQLDFLAKALHSVTQVAYTTAHLALVSARSDYFIASASNVVMRCVCKCECKLLL
jgi:hypothetical protein